MKQIEVKNLIKAFGDIEVLKGVDFSLEKGEVLSIIGSSGGGKTTLLRCLNFLEIASSGEILIEGESVFSAEVGKEPVMHAEAQEKMGLVFQQFNLFPQYSVLGNLTLAPRLQAKKRADYKQNKKAIFAEIEERGHALLEQMGLSDRAGHYPHQLSGGQQQRVAIARALALQPDILCFDEPTSALDPELTGEVLKVIRGLAEQNTTMVIVTHEMAFARDVANRVIFMDGGSIVEEGDARQVIEHPTQERTRQFLSRYSEN